MSVHAWFFETCIVKKVLLHTGSVFSDRRKKFRASSMVLETVWLRQTRNVTEGKSVGGEAPSGTI